MTEAKDYKPIARIYRRAFWGAPWYEAYKNERGEFYPPNTNWRKEKLKLAYPLMLTAAYIAKETSKEDVVLVEDNESSAFGWGYSAPSPQDLVEAKWNQASDTAKQELIQTISSVTGNTPLWYLSEVGVDPRSQSKGIGGQIVKQLIEQAPPNMPIIMRTNADSPMTIIAIKNGMIPIIGPESTLAGKINQLPQDPLNPDRVLYYLGPRE